MNTTPATEIASLQNELIRRIAEELTPKDYALVASAKQLANKKCEQGKHNLVACGYGRFQIEPYCSLQVNVKRAGESNVCAEAGLFSRASMKDDEIVTIVTFHGPDEKRKILEPYVVPPCSMCTNRLRSFAPHCKVIVEFEGALIKVHQKALQSPIPYPEH